MWLLGRSQVGQGRSQSGWRVTSLLVQRLVEAGVQWLGLQSGSGQWEATVVTTVGQPELAAVLGNSPW